jgi:hypothetical protein
MKCALPTCSDAILNQYESDVDCGGTCGTKCTAGQRCNTGADCASQVCNSGVCEAPAPQPSKCSTAPRVANGTFNGSCAGSSSGALCSVKCDPNFIASTPAALCYSGVWTPVKCENFCQRPGVQDQLRKVEALVSFMDEYLCITSLHEHS